MARVRSPNYPNISLPAALERIRKVQAVEATNEMSRESFAQILGYSGLSGPSAKILSSLAKYGLISKVGSGEIKISELAMDIMFGESEQKSKGIKQAAKSPSLFAEINEKWPERQPSDENLRSFLARKGFSMKVLDQVIGAYRDTMSLVSDESEEYDSNVENQNVMLGGVMEMDQALPVTPVMSGEPFRMSITGSRVEVVATLETPQQVDDLLRALTIAKAMVTPVGPMATEYTDDAEGREAEERDEIARGIDPDLAEMIK